MGAEEKLLIIMPECTTTCIIFFTGVNLHGPLADDALGA